jgi:hypothetical protein
VSEKATHGWLARWREQQQLRRERRQWRRERRKGSVDPTVGAGHTSPHSPPARGDGSSHGGFGGTTGG